MKALDGVKRMNAPQGQQWIRWTDALPFGGKKMDMPLPDTNSDHQTKGVKRMNAPKLDSLEDGVLGKPTKKPLPDTNSDHQTKELKRMRLGRQTASSMLQSSQMAIRQDSFEEEREEERGEDNYVDLYGHGKAFATSSWSKPSKGKWDPKQAFLITGDGNNRYWCSERILHPPELTAIWFQFEQPKRVIKIRFEESTYKLQQGGIYEVFASNDYGKCGNNDTQTKLAGGDAMEFSRGKEFTNKESYHCYGVRTYSYGQYIKEDDGTYKVVALRRIQLRIEAPPNGDILRKLLKLTNDVERHGSRLAKVEEAAVYACEIGNVSYSGRTPHWGNWGPAQGIGLDPAQIPQAREVVVTFRLEYGRKPKVHMAATVFKPDKPLENEGWSFYPFEITKTGFKAGVTLRAKNDAYEDSKYEAAWIACGIIDLGNIDFRPVDGRQ